MSNETDTVMDINGLIETIANGYAAAGRAWDQAKKMGADPNSVMRRAIERIGDAAVVEAMLNHAPSPGPWFANEYVGPMHDDNHPCAGPMARTISRMLAAAPTPIPDQAPALECGVMFASGVQLMGVLSATPEGGLRMLTQAANQGPNAVMMAEQFFDASDVMVIMVKREVKLESPSLIVRS